MKSKTLLISYYWFPYNNSGTFRWTNFSRYIDFDVLTCSRPLRSFLDFTIETLNQYERVNNFGPYFPGIVWGFFAPFIALFKKYDVYIITSPPESTLIGAWFMQLLGKNVVIDMRDSIDREKQYFKSLIKFYKWFYKRMKNIVVCYQFLDLEKPVIYSGYYNISTFGFKGYYDKRQTHRWYLYILTYGWMPTQNKQKGYGSGSAQTYRYLNFPLPEGLHPEVYSHKLQSIEQSALKYKNYLYEKTKYLQ